MTDSGMAIYSGTCGSLTLIECDDDDSANGLMSYITRSGLTPGSTIYIRVQEYGNDNNGSFGICVSSPVPPVNDNPCGAIDLNVNTSCSFQTFSTSGATNTTAVTAPSCGSYVGGDVWFSAMVPSNGIVRIDTNSNTITDGSMAVYTGNCGSLTLLQCDTDSSTNGLMPYLNLTGLTPGTTIFIRFWESGNDVFGTFSICLSTDCTSGNGAGSTSISCPNILAGGLGLNGADPSPVTCGSSSCTTLEAEYLQLGTTSNYTVENIVYNPPYQFNCLANPVVVLGKTGRNFAAGMSGGIAYVYDLDGSFAQNCNTEMVDLDPLDEEDLGILKELLSGHAQATGSSVANYLLSDLENQKSNFIKVFPRDYKKVLQNTRSGANVGIN